MVRPAARSRKLMDMTQSGPDRSQNSCAIGNCLIQVFAIRDVVFGPTGASVVDVKTTSVKVCTNRKKTIDLLMRLV
jgi:hypothetical protein